MGLLDRWYTSSKYYEKGMRHPDLGGGISKSKELGRNVKWWEWFIMGLVCCLMVFGIICSFLR